jgi:hypothetical protein
VIGLVEIEWGSEECCRHHSAVPFFSQRQCSNAMISPPWLGCSSLEQWKSIIDFTLQQLCWSVSFVRGGGNDGVDIFTGGIIRIVMIVANVYYVLDDNVDARRIVDYSKGK